MELTNFRAYETLRFDPEPGMNVLVGPNGAGKTSILEAVGYLGTAKSLRAVPDGALGRDGAESAVVRGGLGGGASELTVEAELPVVGRRPLLMNAKRPKRMTDQARPRDAEGLPRRPRGKALATRWR